MTRIFLPLEQLNSEPITITGEQARHLSLVMRIKPDDQITIFDGQGHRYECTVVSSHKKEVIAKIVSKEPYSVESPLSITLAQSMPKGNKMDLILQKATELGVSRIVPLITERSQVRETGKVNRWRKIALSASQQSGRDKVPEIETPVDINEYLKKLPVIPSSGNNESDKIQRLMFSEEKKGRNLKEILSSLNNPEQLILLIGPEGGFSKEEFNSASRNGFIEVSLGPRILRTETAPIAAISIIQYELGDVGC